MRRLHALVCLFALTRCVGILDPHILVEVQVVDERGELIPSALCQFSLSDSVDGHRFTIEMSAKSAEEIILASDNRAYRVEVACDGHAGRFDTGWLDLGEHRRTGKPLELGRITVRREEAPRTADGDPASLT